MLGKYPKISVITPSYNQANYIERTIKSVLDQGYKNLEYIIIDGGSIDETVEVIKKYERHITYWVSEKDNGQYHAIKKGFDRATGDILCWLNSDDVFLPNALHNVAEAFRKFPNIDVLYGNIYYIDKSDNIIKDMRNTRLIPNGYLYKAGFGLSQPEVFWTKSIYDKIGGIDDNGQFAMDYDLFFRFIRAGAKFKFIKKHLSALRFYKDTKTSLISHIGIKENIEIRKKLLFGNSKPVRLGLKIYVWILKIFFYILQGDVRWLIKHLKK
jgi:glycosyltransferase involved in cell wall biosynthesis